VTVTFENLTGAATSGTLIFTLADGVSVANVQTTHGSIQRFDGSIILRVDDVQLSPGEMVALTMTATVDDDFSGSAILLEAEWLTGEQLLTNTSSLLIVDNGVLQLPATGETPFWRNALFMVLALLTGLLLSMRGASAWLRR
jgi:hypothetical protein